MWSFGRGSRGYWVLFNLDLLLKGLDEIWTVQVLFRLPSVIVGSIALPGKKVLYLEWSGTLKESYVGLFIQF